MTGLDTLHSWDPFAILRVIYDLLYGTKGDTATSSIAFQIHDTTASFLNSAPYYLINFFARFAVFSFFFSIVMLIVVIIYARRVARVRKVFLDRIIPQEELSEEANDGGTMTENPKWKLIQEHINSPEPSNWKLAIIEADIMLNDLLDSLHLPGDTIGDKLKAMDKSDFRTLDDAWEAHKIRNAIAHQGSDFLLNEREAKRVISLYENVFGEFELIQG